jgi:putative NADPH-quinone reductase
MNVLVVYCHPRTDSYVHALKEVVVRTLTERGHSVDLLDLYGENFQPAMTAEERGRYNDTSVNLQGIEADAARLRRAQALFFVYPTWWYGLPAMLKGWFDRVWAPGVAFDVNGGVIKPLTTHIRHVAVVTTMGAPWWFSWYVGHPGRMFLSRGLRAICARGCSFTWRGLQKMDSATPAARAAFLEKVRRTCAKF